MKLYVKQSILVWTALILLGTTALAETLFVSEDFEITMRTGPGSDRKIIALIKSGKPMEVVTPGEEWTEVKLSSGKQGWVLSRYLTPKEPSAIVLARLQKKHESVLAQRKTLTAKVNDLESQVNQLQTQLADSQAALKKLTEAHEALKRESADFLNLKAKHDKTVRQLSEVRSKADTYESEVISLQRSQDIKWVLTGAGILILGWIVGFATRRPKKRSSLL